MPTGVGSNLAALEKEERGPEHLGGCPSLLEGLGFKGAQRVVECVEVDHHHATDFAISRSWPQKSVHTGRGGTESRALLEGRCGALDELFDLRRVCRRRVQREGPKHVATIAVAYRAGPCPRCPLAPSTQAAAEVGLTAAN